MNTQLGKNFIVTIMAVVLGLGGLTWLCERAQTNDAPQVAAMTETSQQARPNNLHQDAATYPISDSTPASKETAASPYDEAYRSGYQDAERDCAQSQPTASRATARPATRYYSGTSTSRSP